MKQRTPEEVVKSYAEAVQEVKKSDDLLVFHTRKCTRPKSIFFTEECLTIFFGYKQTAKQEKAAKFKEDKMCIPCVVRLEALNDRKLSRAKLGAARRAVGAVGKRLLKHG